MNYIKEINAFYDQLEYNPLSGSAIALWYALMHINNKTRWKESFCVAGTVLRLKSGLKESTFKRARTELVEKGYVDYEPGERRQAPLYRMIGLTKKWSEDSGDTSVERCNEKEQLDTTQTATSDHTRDRVQSKERITHFYKDNFGEITPFMEESLVNWTNEFGEVLVMEAMKRALESNSGKWRYVKGILQDWKKKGMDSIDKVEAEQVDYRNKRKKQQRIWNQGIPKQQQREIIPDWFRDLKKEKQNVKPTVKLMSPEQIQAQRAEMEKLKKEWEASFSNK